MKIGNIEVKQVAEGVITIQQETEHESRCHVSAVLEVKSESIKGDYLHMLASAVSKMHNLTEKQILELADDCGMFEQHDNARPSGEVVIGFANAVISATLGVEHG